ncbi:MAG: ATP phosphoribosyltransferase regulatory subunit, partial [Acutalibacteraceae bacterium]
CIGDIDLYDMTEVLLLALESLKEIGGRYVLDVSHMGIVTALVDAISDDEEFKKEVMRCLSEKNRHEISDICKKYSVSEEGAKQICDFIGLYGKPEQVLSKLKESFYNEKTKAAIDELCSLWKIIGETEFADKVNFDFSIINDMNYYNGIVFTGFIEGVPESVLSGGRYDKLMRKMGKKSGAIGFAVYLDLLNQLQKNKNEFDVDVLLLYNEKTDVKALCKKVSELNAEGKSVCVQKSAPQKLRFRQRISLIGEET